MTAGCCPMRNTTDQIVNVRLLIETYIQHQRALYHNYNDFSKTYDRTLMARDEKILRRQQATSNGVTPERGEPSVFDMQEQTTRPFTIHFFLQPLDSEIGSTQAYQPPHAQRLSELASGLCFNFFITLCTS